MLSTVPVKTKRNTDRAQVIYNIPGGRKYAPIKEANTSQQEKETHVTKCDHEHVTFWQQKWTALSSNVNKILLYSLF